MTETVSSIQDLIFVLEHSLGQQEQHILQMPFHFARKRYQQLMKLNDAQKAEMDKHAAEMKKSSSSRKSK
jgi:hypothetical protein